GDPRLELLLGLAGRGRDDLAVAEAVSQVSPGNPAQQGAGRDGGDVAVAVLALADAGDDVVRGVADHVVVVLRRAAAHAVAPGRPRDVLEQVVVGEERCGGRGLLGGQQGLLLAEVLLELLVRGPADDPHHRRVLGVLGQVHEDVGLAPVQSRPLPGVARLADVALALVHGLAHRLPAPYGALGHPGPSLLYP